MSSLKKRVVKEETGSESEEVAKKVVKKAKVSGEAVFDIGSKRKVTVSAFKGQTLINIREFYNDKTTGEEKPGNKGIALTLDQWKMLISQVSEIEEAIEEQSV